MNWTWFFFYPKNIKGSGICNQWMWSWENWVQRPRLCKNKIPWIIFQPYYAAIILRHCMTLSENQNTIYETQRKIQYLGGDRLGIFDRAWGPQGELVELFYDLVYVIAIAKSPINLRHISPLRARLTICIFRHDFLRDGSTGVCTTASTGPVACAPDSWRSGKYWSQPDWCWRSPEQVVFNVTIVLMVSLYHHLPLVGVVFTMQYHHQTEWNPTIIYLLSWPWWAPPCFEANPIRLVFSLLSELLSTFATQRLRSWNHPNEPFRQHVGALGPVHHHCVWGKWCGVIGGVGPCTNWSFEWMNFGLAVMIVFALWWLFYLASIDHANRVLWTAACWRSPSPPSSRLRVDRYGVRGLFGEFHSKIAWLTLKQFLVAPCACTLWDCCHDVFSGLSLQVCVWKKQAQTILLLSSGIGF